MTGDSNIDTERNAGDASSSSIAPDGTSNRAADVATDLSIDVSTTTETFAPKTPTHRRWNLRIAVTIAGLCCLLAAVGIFFYHVSTDNHGDQALAKTLVVNLQNKRTRTMADVSRLADTFSQWEAQPKEALTAALDRTIAHNHDVQVLMVADPDGRILAMVDARAPLGQNPKPPVVLDPTDQRRDLVTSKALPMELYRVQASRIVAIEWAAPIRRDGRVTGYVGATASLGPFLAKARSIAKTRMTILDGSCRVFGSGHGEVCLPGRPAGPWTVALSPSTFRARWTNRWTAWVGFLLLLGAAILLGFRFVSDLVGRTASDHESSNHTASKRHVRRMGDHAS